MNKQLKLANRPEGLPDSSTWVLEQNAMPTIGEGELLIKIHYISLDPAMRGWIRDVRSYIPPVQIGEVMRAGAVGEVVASENPAFKVGDYVTGTGGVQQYVATNGKGWIKLHGSAENLPLFLGTLGMPGFTAYFGLLDVGELKAGERVLVSGGAGAVGSVVGQIAKIKGCHVVGIAGGAEKCRYMVEELGFDEAIDYKSESVREAIREKCKAGIDVYFDNVGGEILDAALTRINRKARVVICGAISQYNATEAMSGPANYLSLLVNRARMEGFIVFDYAKDYAKAGAEMAQWMKEGKLKSKEAIFEGIENFHDTFLRLFNGDKKGKLVLKVSEN